MNAAAAPGAFAPSTPLRSRWRRLNARIGLRELARRLGVSAAFLSDVEHGKRKCDKFLESAYVALPFESALWINRQFP